MQRTRRAAWLLIVLVAVALAAEPLLHSHPLTDLSAGVHAALSNDSGLVCATCATATARAIPVPPALTAPVIGEWLPCAAPLLRLARVPHASRPSRAPPSV